MKTPVAVAQPQESLITTRKRETLARVHELKKQIEEHEAKLAQFRAHNFIVLNARLVWRKTEGGLPGGKEVAERQLLALCQERDKILREWSDALAQNAKLSQMKP